MAWEFTFLRWIVENMRGGFLDFLLRQSLFLAKAAQSFS